ncbi:MAG: DNA topoisomerase 3 [Lentisphaeraceae bacterium]|nr:DNA topoisomerase 3 [Lentisphaeraceae bacterium]
MIVVVAEKPSVARDLAFVLGAKSRNHGYIEGNGYAVTWAFGHLVELAEPDDYDPSLKKWAMSTLPIIPQIFRSKISNGRGIRKQFNTIKKLINAADEVVCATDAGREGELIFRGILDLCNCRPKPMKRLWISSLTPQAIRHGFNNLRPLSDYDNLAASAKSRSQCDWLVGLNATRAYTLKFSQGRGVLSVGRVQTPVLALIVNRENEIRNFKPEAFWEISLKYREVAFKSEHGRFDKEEEAQALFQKISGQAFEITEVKEKEKRLSAPLLFDLTELQREMNRRYKFSAQQTLAAAQTLYESKLLSYPRTDSRYLTDDQYPACKSILEKCSSMKPQEVGALNLSALPKTKRIFNNGKVTDHHAIIPTGVVPGNLSRENQLIYQAVLTRFIAVFYPDCIKMQTEVRGQSLGEKFKSTGTRLLAAGWSSLYPGKNDKEILLPAFTVGEHGPHVPLSHQGWTKAPQFFTEASLLTAMETAGKSLDDDELKEAMKEKGLGTPATRAGIIETLTRREYIRKHTGKLYATLKGESLIACISEKTLCSAEMTGEWENCLKLIEQGKMSAETFMDGIKNYTSKLLDVMKHGETNYFGLCPLCKNQVIRGNSGFGCGNWRNGCQFRFAKNQHGYELTDNDVQNLLGQSRLSEVKPFVIEGQQHNLWLSLKNGQLHLQKDTPVNNEALVGKCPECNAAVEEKRSSFKCLNSECRFSISKMIAARKVSTSLAKLLLSGKKSRLLKGFKGKSGKSFSAILYLEKGEVKMEFADFKKSGKK